MPTNSEEIPILKLFDSILIIIKWDEINKHNNRIIKAIIRNEYKHVSKNIIFLFDIELDSTEEIEMVIYPNGKDKPKRIFQQVIFLSFINSQRYQRLAKYLKDTLNVNNILVNYKD